MERKRGRMENKTFPESTDKITLTHDTHTYIHLISHQSMTMKCIDDVVLVRLASECDDDGGDGEQPNATLPTQVARK